MGEWSTKEIRRAKVKVRRVAATGEKRRAYVALNHVSLGAHELCNHLQRLHANGQSRNHENRGKRQREEKKRGKKEREIGMLRKKEKAEAGQNLGCGKRARFFFLLLVNAPVKRDLLMHHPGSMRWRG